MAQVEGRQLVDKRMGKKKKITGQVFPPEPRMPKQHRHRNGGISALQDRRKSTERFQQQGLWRVKTKSEEDI